MDYPEAIPKSIFTFEFETFVRWKILNYSIICGVHSARKCSPIYFMNEVIIPLYNVTADGARFA
jgi:hypothetical protein